MYVNFESLRLPETYRGNAHWPRFKFLNPVQISCQNKDADKKRFIEKNLKKNWEMYQLLVAKIKAKGAKKLLQNSNPDKF
jgi:hypothetical protein